jgi:tRNA-2-methylthio-N6-dimethylallyladenosine synthase
MRLAERARFKNSFIFKYSPRPGTKAHDLYADDIPEEVKRRRNNELLALQTAISLELNQPFVGRTVEVLVEGPSKSAARQEKNGPLTQLTGRTRCDRIVVFEGNERQVGHFIPVTIQGASAVTLFGQVVTAEHLHPLVTLS